MEGGKEDRKERGMECYRKARLKTYMPRVRRKMQKEALNVRCYRHHAIEDVHVFGLEGEKRAKKRKKRECSAIAFLLSNRRRTCLVHIISSPDFLAFAYICMQLQLQLYANKHKQVT